MNIMEILRDYTIGKISISDANSGLKKTGASFHLDPDRNTLTADELSATRADSAESCTGFGLLDSGTGTLDKVEVKDGQLVGCDMGESVALCIIGGKTYAVSGTKLSDTAEVQA